MRRPSWQWIPVLALLALAAASAALGFTHDVFKPALPPAKSGWPARVVSLTPSVTENIFALGLGDRLVGVTTGCDYPPEAKALPKIGGPSPDLERIVALRPDVVAGDGRVSGRHLDRLRAIGVPVWRSSSGNTLE